MLRRNLGGFTSTLPYVIAGQYMSFFLIVTIVLCMRQCRTRKRTLLDDENGFGYEKGRQMRSKGN